MSENDGEGKGTRARLIEATLELLSEKGSDALRTREILERAGVANMSAVSYHFGSLEELRRQALESYFAAMRGAFAGLADEADPHEALILFCRRFAEFVDRNPALERNIVFLAMKGEEIASSFSSVLGDNLRILQTIIARGKGGEADGGIVFDAVAFASALMYPLLLRQYGLASIGLKGDDDAVKEAYFENLVNMILRPAPYLPNLG
jgi:AcrR family transcriptional regulator